MALGRPKIPLAEKVRRLTGQEAARVTPLPFDWPNPFAADRPNAHWAWEFVVADCAHRGVLSNAERNLVYEYCVMYERAMLAGIEWQAIGMTACDENGVLRAHPALRIQDASWDRVRKIGALLGLDPINRNKPLPVLTGELGIADGTTPATIDLMAFARDRSQPPPWERDDTQASTAETTQTQTDLSE